MRRFLMLALVALAAGTLPAIARADNPNQQAAIQIRDQLRASGQTLGRKITVRYANGTVWLQGQVSDRDHYNAVVAAVMATQGVTITQVITDGLRVDGAANGVSSAATNRLVASNAALNPLRGPDGQPLDGNVQALPSSFNARGAMPTSMMQVAQVPPAPAPLGVQSGAAQGAPLPMYAPGAAVGGQAPIRTDQPAMPAYAWPSYAAYPNYAAVTYPKQYSPTAWPYIGPFYPYPQVPLGWRKVNLQWDDGWWWIDFKDKPNCCWFR